MNRWRLNAESSMLYIFQEWFMAILKFSSKEELVKAAAERITADLVSAIEARDEAHLVLSGGGTPRPVYEQIALAEEIDWPKVHIWFADERNVPPDDPGSNYLHRHQFSSDQCRRCR